MSEGPEDGAPSAWIRLIGIVGAVFMALYSFIGVLRDDLHVTLSKSDGTGVHLHGPLSWLCFAAMLMISIGMAGFLLLDSGGGEFDETARRRRFGPMIAIGVAMYVVSQLIGGWGS